MLTPLKIALALTALASAPVGYVFYQAALSPDSWTYEGGPANNWKDNGVYRGAPGPIAGAGLPFVAVLAGGAYWLVRRARRRPVG
jgi:hypothetical protein